MNTATADQLPAWLLRLYRATGVVLAIAGVAAGVTMVMSWVDDPGYVSHGPIATLGVVLAAMIAGQLLLPRGRRFRRRYPVAPESEGRPRARNAVFAGVLAGLAGLLERWLIAYNMDSIDTLGLEPGTGVDVANALVVTLFVCAGVALVFGVIGLFVPLATMAETQPVGFAIAATSVPAAVRVPPAAWAPTHRVNDDGMPAFDAPEPGAPIAMLDPRLPLVVTERRGGWASVRAENGWQGWVHGGELVELGVAAPPMPPMPVG